MSQNVQNCCRCFENDHCHVKNPCHNHAKKRVFTRVQSGKDQLNNPPQPEYVPCRILCPHDVIQEEHLPVPEVRVEPEPQVPQVFVVPEEPPVPQVQPAVRELNNREKIFQILICSLGEFVWWVSAFLIFTFVIFLIYIWFSYIWMGIKYFFYYSYVVIKNLFLLCTPESVENMVNTVKTVVPEPPKPWYVETIQNIPWMFKIFRDVTLSTVTVIWDLTAVDWAGMFFGVIIVVILYFSLQRIWVSFRKMVWRFRGIRYESMMANSDFNDGPKPMCQVSVFVPGLLLDTFNGYGIRVENLLVTPRHVVKNHNQLILQGNHKGKIQVDIKPIMSQEMEDLVYIPVPEGVWAALATTKAKFQDKIVSRNMVTCTGEKGFSNGIAQLCNVAWMLTYSGSTVPGMSGAAYMDVHQRVFGIHQGASLRNNVGVSADLIRMETSMIRVPESTADTNVDTAEQLFANRISNADARLINHKRNVVEFYRRNEMNPDSWANQAEEIEQFSKFEPEAVETKVVQTETYNMPKRMRPTSFVPGGYTYSEHGNGLGEQMLNIIKGDDLEFLRELRRVKIIDIVMKTVSKVKANVDEISKLNASLALSHRFKCKDCANIFVRFGDLMSHKEKCPAKPILVSSDKPTLAQIVKTVQPESAIPSDTGAVGKVVNTQGFHEKKQVLAKPKLKISTLSSKLSGKKRKSQSQEDFQFQMVQSQRNIEKLLSVLVATTAGQSSAPKPN